MTTFAGVTFIRTEGKQEPTCPQCGGAGFFRSGVIKNGSLLEDELTPCDCTVKLSHERRWATMLDRSNMLPFRDRSFDTLRMTGKRVPGSPDLAVARAKSWIADPRGCIVLRGPYGAGKTAIALGIANGFLDLGKSVLFIEVPTLMRDLRDTFRPNSDTDYHDEMAYLKSVTLLVLDELGMEDETQWVTRTFYQIVNHRFERNLPMVITTNLAMQDMEPRIRSRLMDTAKCQVIEIADRDRRLSR